MPAKIYPIILLLFCSQAAFPQIAEWSTPQKPRNKTAYIQILGSNEEGYFLHRSSTKNFNKKPYIEYYRTSLGLEYSQPLPLILKKATVEKILLWGNYLYAFYSRLEPKTGRASLYVQKFDIELNPKGPLVKVTDADASAYRQEGIFRILYSRDKSRIWCYYAEASPTGSQKIYFTQLNEEMAPKFSRNFELAKESNDLKIDEVLADDYGNVFFLTSSPLNARGEDAAKTRYSLLMSNPEKNTMNRIVLDSAENRLNNSGIAINYLEREIVLTGIYSDKRKNGATGYMFSRFNIDSFSVVSSTFQKFEKEFISENIGEQAAEKGEQLADLSVRKLIPRSDAGAILITENFYTTQQSYSYVNNGIPQTQVRNQYNYDNVHVISINPDGSTEWKHVIKKNQVCLSDEDYYSSFVTMVTPDSIHVLFNEKTTGGDVIHYSVHNTGSIDHEILFKSVNTYVFLMPREAKQISNNMLMLATIKDRRFCLLKLIF